MKPYDQIDILDDIPRELLAFPADLAINKLSFNRSFRMGFSFRLEGKTGDALRGYDTVFLAWQGRTVCDDDDDSLPTD